MLLHHLACLGQGLIGASDVALRLGNRRQKEMATRKRIHNSPQDAGLDELLRIEPGRWQVVPLPIHARQTGIGLPRRWGPVPGGCMQRFLKDRFRFAQAPHRPVDCPQRRA